MPMSTCFLPFQSPFTRNRIFLNPQLFLSGFKNFSVHTQRIRIELACSHAFDGTRIHCSSQGSSAIKCVQSMRHKARERGGKFALLLLSLCHHIGLLFGKRLDTNLLRYRIRKFPDSPVHTLSDSLRIYLFPNLESMRRSKNIRICCRIHQMRVDRSRVLKKKSRIEKYPDTCGLGLRLLSA